MDNTTTKQALAGICCAILSAAVLPAHSDRIRNDQWHLRALSANTAHSYSQGDGVTTAVVDTGVYSHPDLRENLLAGVDLTRSSGDGRIDVDSHGTSMAGLIAAHGRSPTAGALGIAPASRILPIRYRESFDQTDNGTLAEGITRATKGGASVINVSATGSPSGQLRSAVENALAKGIVIVAAAGNRPSNRTVGFPAAYDGVLAVGATDRNGNHADFSVSGKQVAISAPGVDIYSTSIDGKYSKATGTSAATAIVAGAVALVRSKYPELSAREVVHRLTATATDKGPPGRDEQYGYGVLNIVAALTADVPPLGPPTNGPRATSTTATTADAAPRDGPDADGGGIGVWVAALGVVAGGAAAVLLALRRRARRDG